MKRALLVIAITVCAGHASAAGRELAPRGGGPSAYGAERPLVAFAGGRFLTIWREHMDSIGLPLKGALSDASGRRISTLAFPIVDTFPGIHLQLLGTGDSFALFWTHHDEAFLTDLDLDGRVLRTRALDFPPLLNMRAAWNGSRFLVAMRHPVAETYSAEALLLERDGTVVRELPIQFDSHSFEIIPSGSGFTLVASGFSGVFAYRVTHDGSATEHVVERVTGAPLPGTPLAASTPDGNVLITWATARGAVGGLRSAVLMSGDGTVSPPRGIFDFRDSHPRPVALMRTGETYLLMYERFTAEQQSLESVRLLADGAVAAPPSETELIERVSASNAASNGSVTLIVFNTPRHPSSASSVAVGADGVARNPETLSLARTRQTQPALGAGGGRFLAVWNDVVAQAAFVRSASAGVDIEPLTDNIVAPALLASNDLAWNGTEYLTIVTIDFKRHAIRLSWDGRPLGAPIFLDSFWPGDAAVTWAGDRWAVVWATHDGLSFATVSRAGIASKVRPLALPEVAHREPQSAALAWNGSTLLLVWTETQVAECSLFPGDCQQTFKTFVTRLTTTGELRDDAPLEIPLAASLSLATSGREFMLLGDTTAMSIDANASPRIVASRRLFNWPAYGDITWDGASYAAALRYSGLRWYLSVTHLDRNANELAPPRGIETLPPDHAVAPSVAALLAGSAVVAIQEGEVRDGARAVLYAERDMTPLPAPPSPPRNVRVRPLGFKYEVTWDASLEGSPELYRVDGAPDVPAGQPLRAITDRYDVRVRAFNAGGGSDAAVWELVPRRRSARH